MLTLKKRLDLDNIMAQTPKTYVKKVLFATEAQAFFCIIKLIINLCFRINYLITQLCPLNVPLPANPTRVVLSDSLV